VLRQLYGLTTAEAMRRMRSEPLFAEAVPAVVGIGDIGR